MPGPVRASFIVIRAQPRNLSPSSHGSVRGICPPVSGGTFSKANRLTATLFRAKAFENAPPSHLRPEAVWPPSSVYRREGTFSRAFRSHPPPKTGGKPRWHRRSSWPKGRRKPVAAAVRARVRKRKCAGAQCRRHVRGPRAGGGDAKRHDEHCPPTLRAARLVKGEVGSSSPRCRSVPALSSLHCSGNNRLPQRRRQRRYSAITPEPRRISPEYQTANWPGVMPRWGLSKRM